MTLCECSRRQQETWFHEFERLQPEREVLPSESENMSEKEPSTFRPFVFTVVEDDDLNVTIEVSKKTTEQTWPLESMKRLR
jgi:hypothetical protein